MGFTRKSIGLFWTVEPSLQDKANARLAGIKVIMIPYQLALARPDVPYYIISQGCELVVRLADEDVKALSNDGIVANLAKIEGQFGRLRYFVIWNEPDSGLDMRYGSPTWGNTDPPDGGIALLWAHKYRMAQLLQRYIRSGLKTPLCTGGWTARTQTATRPPVPGTFAWYAALYDVYQRFAARGVHIYTDNYRSDVDFERLQWQLQTQASMWEPPLVIDELGILRESNVQQMAGYVRLGEWLLLPEQQQPGHCGQLVELVFPFVSNGDARGWDRRFLLTDPHAYELLGRFCAGG